ncbi:hypothetical protein SLE2022_006460 [Rubroshorea leprosula]
MAKCNTETQQERAEKREEIFVDWLCSVNVGWAICVGGVAVGVSVRKLNYKGSFVFVVAQQQMETYLCATSFLVTSASSVVPCTSLT